MHYQNLAYCRFLHVWMIFYFLNLFSYSPIFSFYITFLLHLSNLFYKTNSTKHKIIGIISSDIVIITSLNIKSFNLHVYDTIMIFLYYNLLLMIYNLIYNDNVTVFNLHLYRLEKDDEKNKHENYFQYIVRIWSYILIPCSINYIKNTLRYME